MKKKIVVLLLLTFLWGAIIALLLGKKSLNYNSSSNNLAIYIKENDSYIRSNSNLFPGSYIVDFKNSKCQGVNGESLLKPTDDGTVMLQSSVSAKCSLYFYKNGDKVKEKLIDMGTRGLSENIIGDMYRYVGTSSEVNNYICFGTDTPNENCKNNLDSEYLYRIIGIDRETGKLKLIKANILKSGNTKSFRFNSTNSADIIWENSDLYRVLNDTTYYNNDVLLPENWRSKIAYTTWKYGVLSTPNDKNSAYNAEKVFTTSFDSHIAIMNVSDYLFSYKEDIILFNSADIPNAMYNSWMNLHNSTFELLLDLGGMIDNVRWHWINVESGPLGINPSVTYFIVRPVFYLNENVEIISGDGSIGNPFVIKA